MSTEREIVRAQKLSAKQAAREETERQQREIDKKTGARVDSIFTLVTGSVTLYENEVWSGSPYKPRSIGGAVAGARAEVTTEGQLAQRVSATNMLFFGVFAWSRPKQTGNQKFVLHVTGAAFDFTFVSTTPYKRLAKLADRINNQSHLAASSGAPGAAAVLPGPQSSADELMKFAVMRDRGIITSHEFDVQKKRLLG